jgi:hypothetical protein
LIGLSGSKKPQPLKIRPYQPSMLKPGIVSAPSLSDLVSSYSAVRSMSLIEPRPSQRGQHSAGDAELASLLDGVAAAFDGDRTGAADGCHVGRERLRRTDVGVTESAEQDSQHRAGVGRGADRRAGIGTHALLVDDDRGRQPLEHVDVGPRLRRHEALHEGAVGLVDQPLGLGGDRSEHQRTLAGPPIRR